MIPYETLLVQRNDITSFGGSKLKSIYPIPLNFKLLIQKCQFNGLASKRKTTSLCIGCWTTGPIATQKRTLFQLRMVLIPKNSYHCNSDIQLTVGKMARLITT